MAIAPITNGMLGLTARTSINNAIDYVNIKRNGFVDYNDAATAITPITPSSGVWTKLTNDGAGAFTNKTYMPDGLTDLWDTATDSFDFSELSLGDTIVIRADVTIVTNSPNTELGLRMELGIGAGAYPLQLGGDVTYKETGSHQEVLAQHIYIGDDNTRLNPAEIQINVDNSNTDIKVNGWAILIWRNGH